jgi:uncharacterized protein (DUF885 family)
MKRILEALMVGYWLVGIALVAFAVPDEEGAKLHRLFDEEWEWTLREYPEYATVVGDNRYNDRLTDLSAEAIERRKAHEREMLKRIREIDRSRLTGQDVLSYDLFLRETERSVERQRFPLGKIPLLGFPSPQEWAPVSQMHGVHLDIPSSPRFTPFRVANDYDTFLARLAAYPKQIDQIIEMMKRDIASGWMLPSVPIRKVPPQIEAQLVDDCTKSPLYKPFENFPKDIAENDRSQLIEKGREVIGRSVIPALKGLNQFIKQSYLPVCPQDIAASHLPGGPAFYETLIRMYTTTNLSTNEIHELGKREVRRIHNEMEAIIKETGFNGSFDAFFQFLRTDLRFYYARPEEILPAYRDIAKRADAELPKLFAELPRTPYGIREIPNYEGDTAEYYSPSAEDGSRAGYFNAYIGNVKSRPIYDMEATFLHEAVPGHHLQIARAQELKGLPEFRRNGSYTAYEEGWALYAESLGTDLGFYRNPYSKFGQLSSEMHRACRLVVDTGIHAMGWSREQAIDYFKENTGLSEDFIVAEIDRYIVWPGQALAYKIGELKIKELRAKPSKALGTKFDIRKFHNAVLDDGALPLDLLEQRIDQWIETQK